MCKNQEKKASELHKDSTTKSRVIFCRAFELSESHVTHAVLSEKLAVIINLFSEEIYPSYFIAHFIALISDKNKKFEKQLKKLFKLLISIKII